MKWPLFSVALSLWLPLCLAESSNGTRLNATPEQANTAVLIADIVVKDHYDKVSLDDGLSERILVAYLITLDPYKDVFLKADIESFSEFAHALDDSLNDGELAPVFEIFAVFLCRLQERTSFAARFLESEAALGSNRSESPGHHDWASSRDRLDERWRARLRREADRLSHRNARNVGQTLRNRYEQLEERYRTLTNDEVFRHFIDAYLDTLDPHTGYFLPRRRAAGKAGPGTAALQGIGIQLRTVNEYIVIRRIFEGGPADRSRQLHVGDRILGVAQGPAEFRDVVGWALQDVVDLIRGPAGTEVRLQVLPKGVGPGESPGTLALRRGHIELKEVRVKGTVEARERQGKVFRIAVVDIPSFYIDYGAYGRGAAQYASTTQDVARFLHASFDEDINGVLVDLRGNRGGALIEAVSLAGLFIASGPVVQVQDNAGALSVHRDTDTRIVYAGALAVLVDRYSASASEIFAAAMQDYGRGVILGERTYGKGTVQQTLDLNSFPDTDRQTFGQLVLTIAKYFRVTGESTQLHGITPDISLPAVYAADYGESMEDNALDWERVAGVEFGPWPGPATVGEAFRVRHQSDTHAPVSAGNIDKDAFQLHEIRRAETLSQGIDVLVEMIQERSHRP